MNDKHICTLLLMVSSLWLHQTSAQTSTQNYIQTFDVKIEGIINSDSLNINTPLTKALQTIQYIDGLGRVAQTVQKGFTPSGNDLVKAIKYNGVGLDETNYEPYAVSGASTGNFQENFETTQPYFYSITMQFNDVNAKSPIDYEKSPLNRILKQGAPGSPWQFTGHPQQFEYLSNKVGDSKLNAVCWKATEISCVKSGDYVDNQLYVTHITNEDGAETYEFKDKLGQVVLKRAVLDASTNADTYYVYDDFGLLRFVLSPEGSANLTASFDTTSKVAKRYVYAYHYDARKRMIAKRIPGKEPEFYVYDKTDKIIMTQDGNMRKYNGTTPAFEWMFTKYDALGRVIMTGVTKQYPSQTRDAIQSLADDISYKCWEFISYSGTTRPSESIYYSNQAFPAYSSSNCTLLTLNYYDSYNAYLTGNTTPVAIATSNGIAFTLAQASYPQYQPELLYVTGKATAAFVRYNNYLLQSATYYDVYGRVIQTSEQNQGGSVGYDRFTNLYFGLTPYILKKEHTHFSYLTTPYPTLTELSEYTYDAAGRPLTYAYTYNGTGPVRKITYAYTPLGQVMTKVIKDDANLMQTVDYTYNIRGWLTKINDPSAVSSNGDLFGMELLYNTQSSNPQNALLQVSPCYNGNISGTIWQTAQPTGITTPVTTGQKAYKYSYDKLNRLLVSNFAEMSSGSWDFNNKYSEYIDVNSFLPGTKPYDMNGNILTLYRFGLRSPNYTTIDELKYSYDGNKLLGVDDKVITDNGGDFIDNGHIYGKGDKDDIEYTYDKNGNCTKDLNKEILSITYNYLNQPLSINKTGGTRVEYTYDGAGNKQSQKYYLNGTLTKTTQFITNFVYENSIPVWASAEDGRVVLNSNGTMNINEAHIKDHLGNVRAVCYWQAGTLKTQQVDSYYPFGMSIKGLTANGSATYKQNEYLYNGKMFQDEMSLNWLDYGARFYDPVLGRWHSEDPHTEKYETIGSYNYCFNNPIRFFDIAGKDPGDIAIFYTGADFGQGMTSSTLLIASEVNKHINGGTSIVYSSLYYLNMEKGTQAAYDEILKNYKRDPKGRILLYGYSYGGVLANYLAKRLNKAGIKVNILISIDAANGWKSDKLDRSISSNVLQDENYYESNYGFSTGDFTLSHGAPSYGSSATKVNNHDKSKETFEGSAIDHMNIDDATVNEVIQKLTSILATMKEGEQKTLNQKQVKELINKNAN